MPLYILVLKIEGAPLRRVVQIHHSLTDIYAVVDLLIERKKLKSFQIQNIEVEYAD